MQLHISSAADKLIFNQAGSIKIAMIAFHYARSFCAGNTKVLHMGEAIE